MLSSVMHNLIDIFLSQVLAPHHFPHQFLDDGLAVDAIDQEVVKLVSYFFELSRALLFYY